jgi:hypothetical protein
MRLSRVFVPIASVVLILLGDERGLCWPEQAAGCGEDRSGVEPNALLGGL